MTPRRTIAALCLGLAVPAAPAVAQTVSVPARAPRPVLRTWVASASPWTSTVEPAPTTTNDGAYERLSVGNRTIARAIFEALTTEGTTRLTLDDIAAMRRSGEGGWRRVYEDLHARGLVTEKNLGQAVSRYRGRHQTWRSETTTAGTAASPAGTARPSSRSAEEERDP